MLPTANKIAPNTSRSDGYQVLNISNVNAQNEIVLNDEQLLALIQQYPFLYNPHVRPHNDSDYDAWAWEQITKAFNRTYEIAFPDRNIWYTTAELMSRWKVLQPIVRSLSKINNIKSLPDTLRQTVVKMSVPMDEKPNSSLKKPLTNAQKILLEYEPLVKSLPLVERRRLEAEMMELILNSELESKATIKVGLTELQTIEKDYNEFLKGIGFDELYLVEQNSNETLTLEDRSLPPEYNNLGIISNGTTVLISSNVQKVDVDIENNSIAKSIQSDSTIEAEETENNLLEPMMDKRWVPLDRWRDYVRKCRVRVKRVFVEDDVPLAVIKREKIDKDCNKDYILPD